ncbi:hypothetical protein [Actinomadura kijaniata]|uniref:hypothetical protein n=1 Tax=Actinomadura kijaniata TaxID=46161 RepID=UPI000831CA82|nr:hypothetical protein [Actinomadura kijaniata]
MTIPGGENAARVRQHRTDDDLLAALRREFTGHRIWRSTRYDDKPGDWVATLRDPNVGVDPTVIEQTPEELRERLIEERRRAQGGPAAERWGL